MSLKSQVFDCFPARQYGLVKLLQLADVVETDSIPSAAVECKGRPRLLINPAFVKQHASSPEKLFVLILHELYHVILGHTRGLKSITPLDNFVFDCVINALICRQFPGSQYTSLFTDFYPGSVFPTCFLRPPTGWTPDKPAQLPVVLKGSFKGVEELRRIYRSLYSEEGATYSDLYSLFPKLIKQLSKPVKGLSRNRLVQIENIDLLGGHGDELPAFQDALGEDFLHSALSNIAHDWPAQASPMKGRELKEFLAEKTITVTTTGLNKALLSSLISRVAEVGEVLSDSLGTGHATVQYQTPVRPMAGARRDIVQLALGFKPLLFQGEALHSTRQQHIEPVHVYLDVSGSVDSVLDALYGAVISAGHQVHPQIHLFSTEVRDISFAQLKKGRVISTGGTRIDCVARHIESNKVRSALLVTDGHVGQLTDQQLKLLSKVRLAVAYTPKCSKEPLSKVARQTGVLSLSAGARA